MIYMYFPFALLSGDTQDDIDMREELLKGQMIGIKRAEVEKIVFNGNRFAKHTFNEFSTSLFTKWYDYFVTNNVALLNYVVWIEVPASTLDNDVPSNISGYAVLDEEGVFVRAKTWREWTPQVRGENGTEAIFTVGIGQSVIGTANTIEHWQTTKAVITELGTFTGTVPNNVYGLDTGPARAEQIQPAV